MEEASLQLEQTDDSDLATLPLGAASSLAERLGIVDNGFEGPQDLRDRLILLKRKNNNSGHKPFPQFSMVQKEAATKRRNLLEIYKNIKTAFSQSNDGATAPLIEPLSEILRQERLLRKANLLDELTDRIRILKARKTSIIVAGETNSGKSTLLNVLLCQNILPTDILHCTLVVCKIVYSHAYSIETLDSHYHKEEYFCNDCDETREKLKILAACGDVKKRQEASDLKEITLKMPAEILKSGITLIDTPGIGENAAMDGVTSNFVKEAQASAFIYIIKSDGAGGVQEDRLLAFLRAVKEHYKQDSVEGTFDPQAAMFVCHRWDTINPSEANKVKRNALIQLEMVWPGFQPTQTFLFSSKKNNLHLNMDSDYITDNFNDLLKGLKHLIDMATHNVIKYQYCWAKTFLRPSCQHLRSMITHCKTNNESLEEHFREVAEKQEHLMRESNERVPVLHKIFQDQKQFLLRRIAGILSLTDACLSVDLDEYEDLLYMCSKDKFLANNENRKRFDQQIMASLIRYCDDYILREDILKQVEECILEKIQDHLGLFQHQMRQIKKDMHGTDRNRRSNASFSDSYDKFNLESSYASSLSLSSNNDDDFEMSNIPDPIALGHEVENFLERRKTPHSMTQILKSGKKFGKKIIDKIGDAGHSSSEPKHYLDSRIRKLAADSIADINIMEQFVNRYLHFSERCIMHAVNCIPQFIAVNNEVMTKIRDHREQFLEDKQLMKDVMESLEPYRAQLQGYGSLYMEDVHADQINFMTERRISTVKLEPNFKLSVRPNDDSGFADSGSNKTRVRSFWAHFRIAKVSVDGEQEVVMIKTNTFNMDETNQYSEIAALRCLKHENIALFYANTRIDCANSTENEATPAPKMPSFIFKGKLMSASIYRNTKSIDIENFLLGLWKGLDFIHRELLVHLELNLDTVMVDFQSGTVKLCQQCKPRVAHFPEDLSVKTNAAICLSPSVLHGHEYQIIDDIFAFGLLLWELLYPDSLPYSEQRQWPLNKFIAEVNPAEMLKPELESLNAPPPVKVILEGSLICTRGKIITMAEIHSFVEGMYREPTVTTLRSQRSRPKQRRVGIAGLKPNNLPLHDHSGDVSSPLAERDEENTATDLVDSTAVTPPQSNSSSLDSTRDERNVFVGLGTPVEKTPEPKRPPRRRPDRHSQIEAPDVSRLEIPTRHRRPSLPNMSQQCLKDKSHRLDILQYFKKSKVNAKDGREESPSLKNGMDSTTTGSDRTCQTVLLEATSALDLTTGAQSKHIRRSHHDLSSEFIAKTYVSPLHPQKKGLHERKTSMLEFDAYSTSHTDKEDTHTNVWRGGHRSSSNRSLNSNSSSRSPSSRRVFFSQSSRGVSDCQDDILNTDDTLGRVSTSDPQVNSIPQEDGPMKRHNAMRGASQFRRQPKDSQEKRETRRLADGDIQVVLENEFHRGLPVRSRTFSTGEGNSTSSSSLRQVKEPMFNKDFSSHIFDYAKGHEKCVENNQDITSWSDSACSNGSDDVYDLHPVPKNKMNSILPATAGNRSDSSGINTDCDSSSVSQSSCDSFPKSSKASLTSGDIGGCNTGGRFASRSMFKPCASGGSSMESVDDEDYVSSSQSKRVTLQGKPQNTTTASAFPAIFSDISDDPPSDFKTEDLPPDIDPDSLSFSTN